MVLKRVPDCVIITITPTSPTLLHFSRHTLSYEQLSVAFITLSDNLV